VLFLFLSIRFEIAAKLCMNEDSPILKEILKQMPSDMDWKESSPIESIYKKLGLQRYSLSGLAKWVEKGTIETETEKLTTNASGGTQSTSLRSLSGGSSSSTDGQGTCVIKVENPVLQEFKQVITVLKSGKGAWWCVFVFVWGGLKDPACCQVSKATNKVPSKLATNSQQAIQQARHKQGSKQASQ